MAKYLWDTNVFITAKQECMGYSKKPYRFWRWLRDGYEAGKFYSIDIVNDIEISADNNVQANLKRYKLKGMFKDTSDMDNTKLSEAIRGFTTGA